MDLFYIVLAHIDQSNFTYFTKVVYTVQTNSQG